MTPSLTTLVRRALKTECALPSGTVVLVAVSGGPDSMALLSALARVAPTFGVSVAAHGVDHGLRPEAGAELDLVEAFALRIGVPFERTRVSVARGGNLQARAREARWTALVAAARRNEAAIATAHHADDRAETLLMRLLRGSGARGLAVLPPRASPGGVTVVRPLLRARRADVMAHVARHGVPFATDPSNEDPRFLRTRVRREVLPLLASLDPNVVGHLTTLADELAEMGDGSLSWSATLPRPTQEALARLVRTRSPKERVWLPGGLVVKVVPIDDDDAKARPSNEKLPADKTSG